MLARERVLSAMVSVAGSTIARVLISLVTIVFKAMTGGNSATRNARGESSATAVNNADNTGYSGDDRGRRRFHARPRQRRAPESTDDAQLSGGLRIIREQPGLFPFELTEHVVPGRKLSDSAFGQLANRPADEKHDNDIHDSDTRDNHTVIAGKPGYQTSVMSSNRARCDVRTMVSTRARTVTAADLDLGTGTTRSSAPTARRAAHAGSAPVAAAMGR